MGPLDRLLSAVRSLSAHTRVTLIPIPDREDLWVVQVSVGSVVVVETAAGEPEAVIGLALKHMEGMSTRMLAASRRT